jgi:glycosyltransferase involved in cell wall biosynthesis
MADLLTGPSPAGSRPRVLVLAESLPWPTLKGGDHRTWQNVVALSAVADVAVFGLCANDSRRTAQPPLPLASWSATRDPALTSPPPKGMRLDARAWLFDPDGHPSDLLYGAAAAVEIESLLAEFRPDVVVLEGLWVHRYLPLVRAAGSSAIVDCHNVEASVFRELAGSNDRSDLEGRLLRDVVPARTESIERAAVGAVDQLWVCSEADEARLRALYEPEVPVHVIPNGVNVTDYLVDSVSRIRDQLTIIFPAIFSYLPNAHAASFLVSGVFPRLSASGVPCRLELPGPMPTAELLAAAARDPRIVVSGPVPDVRPLLAAATVLAVPLRHGGGTRLKVLEAFAAGLPVVSSAKGAEGLGAEHGVHLLIAETADQFVTELLAVWEDADLAERLARNALALVTERFSWQVIAPRLQLALAQLLPLTQLLPLAVER